MYTFTFGYNKTQQARIMADTEEQARDLLASAWVNGEKVVSAMETVQLLHKEEASWVTK